MLKWGNFQLTITGITMTDALKKIGVDFGDVVEINVREQQKEIVIKKSQRISLPEWINVDFVETLQAVMTEYDATLKGLKER